MEIKTIKNAISIETKANEFLGNAIIRDLIYKLKDKIPVIREVRGDGNCFYRAFGFAYLEYILTNKLNNRIEHLKNMIRNDSETWNICKNYFPKNLINKELMVKVLSFYDADKLQNAFNDNQEIDAMTIFIFRHYARMGYNEFDKINSAHKAIYQLYSNQLNDIRTYGAEATEGSIFFLVNALHVNLTIFYQDRSQNVELPYTPILYNKNNYEDLNICLYFRPGHYDIGYDVEFSNKNYKFLFFIDYLDNNSQIKLEDSLACLACKCSLI